MSPLFFLEKLATFFAHHYRFLFISTRTFFLPVRPLFFTILCQFSHQFFFLRVSPPGGCHQERSAPFPLPAFSSDATGVRNTRFVSSPHAQHNDTDKRRTRLSQSYYLFIYLLRTYAANIIKNTHVDIHNTVKILKLHKIQGYKKPTLRCQRMFPRYSV